MTTQLRKYWMVKDGVVGTAHINREKHAVDFRPSRMAAIKYDIVPSDLGDRPDEEVIKTVLANTRVMLLPAKGVSCREMLLIPTHIAHTVRVNKTGLLEICITHAAAVYEGIEVHATKGWYGIGPVIFASLAKRRETRFAAAEKLRLLKEANPEPASLTARQAIKFGKPVFRHLNDQDQQRLTKAMKRVQRDILAHFGITDIRILPDWAQVPATLREQILAERELNRVR